MMTEDEAKERATCSTCLARTYRGEECVCENGGDAEDFDVLMEQISTERITTMSDENKVIIERHPPIQTGPLNVHVENLSAVAHAVFEASQYYGAGYYVAKLPTGERVYEMECGWIDDDPQAFMAIQRTEHEAWGAVVSELRKRGVGDMNAGQKDESLHDSIVAWAEELVQLRLNDPDHSHAETALYERREKYLGTI